MTEVISKKKQNYPEKASKFQKLKYRYQFQHLLKVNPFMLDYHINKPIYYSFQVPKKKGGFRKIQSPNEDLKKMQAKLNYYLQALYFFEKPKCVHGFVFNPYGIESRMYIVSNALPHCNKKHVLNLDIKDFFPSIKAKQVRAALVKEPFAMSDDIAVVIALLCTYKSCLPTGAPSSPILSNIVCLDLDRQLEAFSEKNDISYTRYADDLTFSSNNKFDEDVISGIRSLIANYGLTINDKKFRLVSSKGKQIVTGLIVNKKPNVDRRYIRNLRAILHSWKFMGVELACAKHYKLRDLAVVDVSKFIRKIAGQIEFVGQVRGIDDGIYNKLRTQLKTNLDSNA